MRNSLSLIPMDYFVSSCFTMSDPFIVAAVSGIAPAQVRLFGRMRSALFDCYCAIHNLLVIVSKYLLVF